MYIAVHARMIAHRIYLWLVNEKKMNNKLRSHSVKDLKKCTSHTYIHTYIVNHTYHLLQNSPCVQPDGEGRQLEFSAGLALLRLDSEHWCSCRGRRCLHQARVSMGERRGG